MLASMHDVNLVNFNTGPQSLDWSTPKLEFQKILIHKNKKTRIFYLKVLNKGKLNLCIH